MSIAFDAALSEVLVHEGGYSNNPHDPGGRTNLGVTQHVWEQYTGHPATEAEMRGLTREKVAPLYRRDYWQACNCDRLPPGLALCVFDFAVNAGPGRACRFLQRLVGVPQDGQIGPKSLAAVQTFCGGPTGERVAVSGYQDLRRAYYRSLPTFKVFGKGWLRRCDEVEAEGLKLAGTTP